MSIERYYRRRNRPARFGRKELTTLDHVNNELAEIDMRLHPTKGFRKLNPARTLAEHVTRAWKSGAVPYTLQSVIDVRDHLREIRKGKLPHYG